MNTGDAPVFREGAEHRARGCLAVLAFEQGSLDEAERYLQETLRFDPADDDARAMLRQIAQRRGQSKP